jgi:hypothetical protein
MTAGAGSENRSVVPGIARSGLRTPSDRRPRRQYWNQPIAVCSLWQLTTRPPRASTDGWGSGSQLPIENRCPVQVGGADGGQKEAG